MPTSAFTAVTWAAPTLDPYTFYSAAHPTRCTPQQPGWYLVIANLGYAPNATGARVGEIQKNGSTIINQVSNGNAGSGFNTVIGVMSLVQCNGSSDYFELVGDQNSGASLNTVPAVTTLTALWVHA